jgi:hypothetical protein
MPRRSPRNKLAPPSPPPPPPPPPTFTVGSSDDDDDNGAAEDKPAAETVRVDAKLISKPKAVEVTPIVDGPKIAIPNEMHDAQGRPPIFQVRTDNQLRQLAEESQRGMNHNIACLNHKVAISLIAGNVPLNVWKLHKEFVANPNAVECTADDLEKLIDAFREAMLSDEPQSGCVVPYN